jgi:hypothetical protein
MTKYFIPFFLLINSYLLASVEHKDEFIDSYLSNISSNMNEKIQLVEHIKKNLNGIFIDVGTGGDAIAIIAKQLPKGSNTTLIASDIDPMVINSIPKRRPEINEFLNSSNGPTIELVTMSATNMSPIKDSSIFGVGASAVAHEVFSYTANKAAPKSLCKSMQVDRFILTTLIEQFY